MCVCVCVWVYSTDKCIVLIYKIDCTIVCNYQFRWINNPNQFFHTQKVYVNFCLIITYRLNSFQISLWYSCLVSLFMFHFNCPNCTDSLIPSSWYSHSNSSHSLPNKPSYHFHFPTKMTCFTSHPAKHWLTILLMQHMCMQPC